MFDHEGSSLPRHPHYRINTVAEMLGLSAPNLRAWERRYGVPKPHRGKNAYRLYSHRDILILKKMKALCTQGYSPSEAAKIALEPIAEGLFSSPKEPLKIQTSLESIIKATYDFDPITLDRALTQATQLGSAWEVYEHIFEPALISVGESWRADLKYVAHEHMLSQAIKGTLTTLLKTIRPPNPRKKVLCACIQNELHDIPLNALALRTSHAGCLPIILGANTPPKAIANAVEHLQPDLIILSATTTEEGGCTDQREREREREAILREYHEACAHRPWLIGGKATLHWTDLPVELERYISNDLDVFDHLLESL
jgi:MerR family transcriptional regulator, light-induced transcriptional regulator